MRVLTQTRPERHRPERHPGRKRVTSREELERAAFALFGAKGFEETTVDDIAAAAGIGRRTFFRYFPSKNDVAWGEFDRELDRMRAMLKDFAPEVPLMEAVRLALIDFNAVPAEQVPLHRRRMELILRVPTLFAHSALRFTAWRQVIAEFVAARTGRVGDELAPQAIAHAVLGVALAAYEHWLDDAEADLAALLDDAMRQLDAAFAGNLR
ncbi:MAG: mycofactocin system transcriptional regulator [Nocardiopsaceae bacterium]|nr:mycofactocin system transcriptional regulator [Nocardiopsaceae bacterium]